MQGDSVFRLLLFLPDAVLLDESVIFLRGVWDRLRVLPCSVGGLSNGALRSETDCWVMCLKLLPFRGVKVSLWLRAWLLTISGRIDSVKRVDICGFSLCGITFSLPFSYQINKVPSSAFYCFKSFLLTFLMVLTSCLWIASSWVCLSAIRVSSSAFFFSSCLPWIDCLLYCLN